MDRKGWLLYSATGDINSIELPGGTDTQIQYNASSTLTGSSEFIWDYTNKQLKLDTTNVDILMKNITAEPTPPAQGYGLVYTKTVSGKTMLKVVGNTGLDSPLQNALFQNNTVLFTPGAAAGVWQGTVGANFGTPTIALPTTTNLATMLRRSLFPTVVTTANQQVGTRSEAMFYRGAATGSGGFFFCCRFMLSTWTAGNRLFVGMVVGTTAVTTVQPSSNVNMCGFGVDAAETAITFMHNDATAGTATKDTAFTQPALATNQGYVAYIFCKPNDNTVYYRLDDLNLGTTLVNSSTSTDLPVNTTALTAFCLMGNAANTGAAAAVIGINRIYIETDT